MQFHHLAIGAGVLAVGIQAAGHLLAALLEAVLERAAHQTKPVAVGNDLVVGIDCSDRVLAVHDRRQCGLHQQVIDASRIGLADGAVAIDLDLDVQAVVANQERARRCGLALEADELLGLLQADGTAIAQRSHQLASGHGVSGDIGVRGAGKRCGLVQHLATEGDHLLSTHRIVALGEFGAVLLGNRIGAVERVVERSPARIGSIERIARIHYRHNELGPRLNGELVIDIGGADLGISRDREQVADGGQEGLVGSHVLDGAWIGTMPGINLGLDAIALSEQGCVSGGQIMHERIEPAPERGRVHTAARQGLFLNESLQAGGHLKTLAGHSFGHVRALCT